MAAVRLRLASELRSGSGARHGRISGDNDGIGGRSDWRPLGIVVGRWVWILFAHQLGIAPRPAVPLFTFVVLAAAALVIANVVAILPGRAAARVQPALVLRSE
jgi:hypothetical protein